MKQLPLPCEHQLEVSEDSLLNVVWTIRANSLESGTIWSSSSFLHSWSYGLLNLPETNGLSSSKMHEFFGDDIVVQLTHITDEVKVELDKTIFSNEVTILATKGTSVHELERGEM